GEAGRARMIYKVRHRTTYRYEKTSTYARCVFRLRPQDSSRQSVFHHTLTTDPESVSSHPRPGPFGEATVTVVIEQPHSTLVVEARSVGEVHRGPGDPSRASAPWEAIRGQALEVGSLEPDSPAVFLYPSLRVPVADPITEYGRVSFTPGRPVV